MALRLLGRWRLEKGDLPGARQQARVELAHLAWLMGDFKEAERLATEAADWYGHKEMRGSRARALALLSQALLGQGRTAQAWETARQAHALSERSEDLELRVEVATAIAPAGVASEESARVLASSAGRSPRPAASKARP